MPFKHTRKFKFYFEHIQSPQVTNSKKDTLALLSFRAKLTDAKEFGPHSAFSLSLKLPVLNQDGTASHSS